MGLNKLNKQSGKIFNEDRGRDEKEVSVLYLWMKKKIPFILFFHSTVLPS